MFSGFLSVAEGSDATSCDILLPSESGMFNSSEFFGAVGHGIHSIGLEDLRYYFDPATPVLNCIPNVNVDLTSEAPNDVLKHALAAGYTNG